MVERFMLSGILLLAAAGSRVAIDEAAMFSAQLAGPQQIPIGMNSPDATRNYQLLLNVMHWLARAKGTRD